MLVQIFIQGCWHDAAHIHFAPEGSHPLVSIEYLQEYLTHSEIEFGARNEQALSVNAPVEMFTSEYGRWPGLLDDLLPVGKTRDWWINRLDVNHLSNYEANIALLQHTCMAPIGNIRVKHALLHSSQSPVMEFSVEKVCSLDHDFLEYANAQGAAVGGATGATGVAPKLLLMRNGDKARIDGDFAGQPKTASPYLVKFARNNRTTRDKNILRAEACYYHLLPTVLQGTNIRSIATQGMELLEVEGQVSLWLPRFDVIEHQGILHRIGMESVYSVIDAGPGSAKDHFDVIQVLWERLGHNFTQTKQEFVIEYVIRDLLNLVFGNSDNHGRNMSFIKQDGKLNYAPIYDFAPMKADEEQITRLFKWGRNCEMAGKVDYPAVAQQLEDYCDPQVLLSKLKALKPALLKVPAQLAELGCPEQILDFPAIGFKYLPQKLQQMGL